MANPNEDGYKIYPSQVHAFHSIALDVLISGLDPETIDPKNKGFKANQIKSAGTAFERLTFFERMEEICATKHGKGWRPVPVEFRLTGLGFADKMFTPRMEIATIHFASKDGYNSVKTPMEVPLAHFYIDGYWVFKCEKEDKKSDLYAIFTNSEVRTLTHSPFDKSYAVNLSKLTEKYKNDTSFVIGRGYDRNWTYTTAPWFEKGYRLDGLKAISGKLKVGNKELMLSDIKAMNIFGLYDK